MNILNIKQAYKTSFQALKANKIRSFLTMLGIIIGVASVIIIMSVGAGAQSLILGQIEDMGTNLIFITPGKADEKSPPTSMFGILVTSLSLEDFKSIEKNKKILGVESVTAYVSGMGTISFQNNSYDSSLEGVFPSYLEVEGGTLLEGRFFTEEENNNLSKVVVLGYRVKEELFGDANPIAKKIKIKKQVFEVVGVLEERGKVFFRDYDDKVFLPLKTMQKKILGINYLNNINIRANDSTDVDSLIIDLEDILRDNHGIKDLSGQSDDFSVKKLGDMLDMVKTITNALRYFLALMAGLSLIVGGIGIMNIMLISVNERTREIGLRKALGANNHDINRQFLIESIFLTLFGGIIGIILGLIISWLIATVMKFLNYDWALIISPFSVFLAIIISSLIGLIFGIYPAKKASKLEPVEALSYE